MMARFKRWTHGVVASIDGLIVQVENHEALASSALCELERGVARSKLELVRVRRDGTALEHALSDEREAEQRWRERAKREPDEARALECLRRAHRSRTRAAELATNHAEHERIAHELSRDVGALEHRLLELRQRRSSMRTRQTRAEAFSGIQGTGDAARQEIGAIFARWEERVLESEVASGCLVADIDGFDREFLDAEEQALLKLELSEL